jgi:hypothetical protein
VENRGPITRAADQTENIKLIIEFWLGKQNGSKNRF